MRRFDLLRPRALAIIVAVLALTLAGSQLGASSAPQAPATAAAAQGPNIIFIFTDDMDTKALAYMPHTQALLADEGTTFENFIYNIALCCPSRATMLRGQYAHNTGVYSNLEVNGGFGTFYRNGNESSTVATWLDPSYETAYIGKYFNGYPRQGDLPGTYVPPGWDEWFATSGGYSGYNYRMNSNGRLVTYGSGAQNYFNDVMANRADAFLRNQASSTQPFYLTISPVAAHHPYVPAPRHSTLFPGAKYPRTPSFNEADVRDKPLKPSLLSSTEIANIDTIWRKRIQSLQSVDEMVARLVATLEAQGKLDNTIIAFTSDNGFHMGEHRIRPGKHQAYEEDIRVPLIVRGPGIPANAVRSELVGNVDIAPSFAAAAGVTPPSFVDGRSFFSLLDGDGPWRNSYLLQRGSAGVKPYDGLRTERYTYIEHASGFRELYDLQTDPYQLNNYHRTASSALKTTLRNRLQALKGCDAGTCRSVEQAPLN